MHNASPKWAKATLLLVALLAFALVYREWLFRLTDTLTHGDWGYYLQPTAITLRLHYFSVWLSDYSFGRVLLDVGQAPTYFLYGAFAKYLSLSFAVSERLVHLWPAIIFAPISSYFLVNHILKNKIAGALGAVVYCANTYFLTLQTGHLTLAGAYAFAPFAIYFFLKYTERPSLPRCLLSAGFLTICTAYEPRAAYIIIGLQAVIWIGILALNIPGYTRTKQYLWASLLFLAPLALFGLFNLYWMLGLALVGGGVGDGVLTRGLFGSQYFSLNEALTLFHPYWNGAQPIPFVVQPIPIYFWLIPAMAFAGAIAGRRNRYVVVFGIVALVGVFLAKQEDPPFSWVYYWLFTHVPGFSAFREASKFYLIIAIGYSVLIPALYVFVQGYLRRASEARWAGVASVVAICLVFLPNLLPIARGTIGTTFTPREIPAAFRQVNNLLASPAFARYFWVPRESRWGINTATHPRISAIDIAQSSWAGFLQGELADMSMSSEQLLTQIFSKDYAPALFNNGAVSKVIVPPRDFANDDDFFTNYGDDRSRFTEILNSVPFLKKDNHAPAGFDIYTNPSAKPYVSAFSALLNIPLIGSLSDTYNFAQQELDNKDIQFVVSDQPRRYTTDIVELFSDMGNNSFHGEKLLTGTYPAVPEKPNPTLYADKSFSEVDYLNTGAKVTLTNKQAGGSLASPRPDGRQTISFKYPGDKYLVNGLSITRLYPDGVQHSLGTGLQTASVQTALASELIPDGDLSQGLWAGSVEDCNNYDNHPSITMTSTVPSQRNAPAHAVSLSARKHIACTGPLPVPVDPKAKYVLSFKYQVEQGNEAAFRLLYDDSARTVSTTNIGVANDSWHQATNLVSPPPGAKTVRVMLMARPSSRPGILPVVSYSELSLRQLQPEGNLSFPAKAFSTAQLRAGDKITYTSPGYSFANLIKDPSFEAGLWAEKVSDCDAYDDRPEIGMQLSSQQSSDGKNSLELTAKRHIACTGTIISPLQENALLFLGFDYRSPNAASAGFSVEFNDPNSTVISKHIPIQGSGWVQYRDSLAVPAGATLAHLTFYSYAEAGGKTQQNYYDNVRASVLPAILGHYFAVTKPAMHTSPPRSVTWKAVSQTKKTIQVKAAGSNFFLAMSEAYHPKWRLEFDNAKAQGLDGWVPWARPDAIATGDHFKLNDFENGWYIDVDALCVKKRLCQANADGTYNLDLVAEFTPQRGFYIGLIISGLAVAGGLGYLGWYGVRRWRHPPVPQPPPGKRRLVRL